MKRIAYLAVLSITAFLISTNSINAQNRTVLAEAERISGDKFGFVVRTPMGAAVLWCEAAIIEGFSSG